MKATSLRSCTEHKGKQRHSNVRVSNQPLSPNVSYALCLAAFTRLQIHHQTLNNARPPNHSAITALPNLNIRSASHSPHTLALRITRIRSDRPLPSHSVLKHSDNTKHDQHTIRSAESITIDFTTEHFTSVSRIPIPIQDNTVF